MEYKKLKSKIIEHYGADHQLAKSVEELTEFIHVAARRLQSGQWNKVAFYEELADVYVVLDQVKLIFCEQEKIRMNEFENILADEIKLKLERTKERMVKDECKS